MENKINNNDNNMPVALAFLYLYRSHPQSLLIHTSIRKLRTLDDITLNYKNIDHVTRRFMHHSYIC